jgi:hypothetical protein
MLKILHFSGLVVVASILAACATPRYESIRSYQPPAGQAGQACIQGCNQVFTSCQSTCKAAWQACTARVDPQVDAHFAQALNDYAAQLRRYRSELDLYQMDLWGGWGQPYGMWYSPWPYRPYSYYPAPFPPGYPPSREAVQAQLYQAQCKDDCGCLNQYDACYTGCGGSLKVETRRIDK